MKNCWNCDNLIQDASETCSFCGCAQLSAFPKRHGRKIKTEEKQNNDDVKNSDE